MPESILDTSESRGQSYASPRDNVLFELGLFMGRLGPKRVFIVHEADVNLKLPADLAGIGVLPHRGAKTIIWPRPSRFRQP
jgi:CRP/FNR family cyclic AMP-dependent transcriptional regulator